MGKERGRGEKIDTGSGEKCSRIWQYVILGRHRTGVTYSFSVVFLAVHIEHVLSLPLGKERNLITGRTYLQGRRGVRRGPGRGSRLEGAPGPQPAPVLRPVKQPLLPQPSGH